MEEVILTESHLGRDSLVGAAIMLNLMSNESQSVNNLFNMIPKFYIEKSTINIMDDYSMYLEKLKNSHLNDNINEDDGLKIIRDDEWIHIRKSNTEPILRIIAESKSVERSKELIEKLKMKLNKGQIIELDVTSLAYGGLGVSHYNDITIFVKGGLPGDKLKAKIYKKKKNYLEAYSIEKIQKSDFSQNHSVNIMGFVEDVHCKI